MASKKIYFLSHIITKQTPLHGGKESVVLKSIKSISRGDSCNTMGFNLSNHSGTHVDAPLHFIEKGSSVTDYKAKDWIFEKIEIIEINNIEPGHIVSYKDINKAKDCDLLLIKTGFEKHRDSELYWEDSPGLDPKLANWIKSNCPSIKAVGVDFISISNLNNRELGRQAHRAFLGSNIILIEDMKLSDIGNRVTSVIVLPLLVDKADASPCTVLGIEER